MTGMSECFANSVNAFAPSFKYSGKAVTSIVCCTVLVHTYSLSDPVQIFVHHFYELPWMVPIAFMVHIKGEPTIPITIKDGEWSMQASKVFVMALSEWIEAYYE